MPQIIFIDKSIVIKATPARLFKALTDAQQLMRWAADRVESDPREGGQVMMAYNAHEKRGEYRRMIPGLEVAVRWTKFEEAFPEDLTVYRLEKLKQGQGTRVRVVDFAMPEEAESLDTLWTARLKKLKKLYQRQSTVKKPAASKKTTVRRRTSTKAASTQRKSTPARSKRTKK